MKVCTHRLCQCSELLEKLCLSLYDMLRPLIIHVIHLETLSELCGILKNEMLEDHVHNNGTARNAPTTASQGEGIDSREWDFDIYICNKQTLLSKVTYNKCICQKRNDNISLSVHYGCS